MPKREYIEKNRQWLADKAQEAGVKPLPKGIYYKVIASGDKDGRKPSARSVVTAHYTGRTINGRTFDSSRGGSPLAARLSDLITGWSIAMQQMHVGDRWEVYIPAEMAYGKLSQPGIPGGCFWKASTDLRAICQCGLHRHGLFSIFSLYTRRMPRSIIGAYIFRAAVDGKIIVGKFVK